MENLILILFYIFLLLVSSKITKIRRPEQKSAAYSWFSFFWIAGAFVDQFGVLSYYHPLTTMTVLYIMLFHAAFASGAILRLVSVNLRYSRNIKYYTNQTKSDQFSFFVSLAGLFFMCIGIIDRISVRGISISDLIGFDNISALRQANFNENLGTHLGALYFPINILASASYFSISSFFYARGYSQVSAKWISIKGVIIITLIALTVFNQTIILAGRGALIYMAVIYFSCYALGRQSSGQFLKFSKKALFCFVLISIPLSVLSTSFQVLRDKDSGDNTIAITRVIHDAAPADSLYNVAASNRFVGFYLIQIGYITSPPYLFQNYVNKEHDFPGPFYGHYNFTYLYQITYPIFRTYIPFQEIRKELFRPLVENGIFGNVWTGLPRDLVADFGYLGASIFLFMFGWLCQLANDRFLCLYNTSTAVLLSCLRLVCVWSAFHSAFFIDYFFFFMLLSVLNEVRGRINEKKLTQKARNYKV